MQVLSSLTSLSVCRKVQLYLNGRLNHNYGGVKSKQQRPWFFFPACLLHLSWKKRIRTFLNFGMRPLFWSEKTRTITNHASCQYYNDYCTHQVHVQSKNIMVTEGKMVKKTSIAAGPGLATLRSTFFVTSNSSVLCSLLDDPAPWCSGWVVPTNSWSGHHFTVARIRTLPFKGISIQTAASHGFDYSMAEPAPP